MTPIENPGPFAWLAKQVAAIFTWIGDIFSAPKRLRALEQSVKAQSDPRPTCTGCGIGKVSIFGIVNHDHWGRCDHCSTTWSVSDNGKTLYRPIPKAVAQSVALDPLDE